MEWPRLKNIIILILLLANLFLLVLVLFQEYDSAQDQEQALENTIGVLERSGIRVEPGAVPAEMELAGLTVKRDQEAEAELAAALLGECGLTDLGSGRYAYQSGFGSAEFRSNGSFRFSLKGTPGIWKELWRHCRKPA